MADAFKLGRPPTPFSFDRGLDDVTHKRNDVAQGEFSMPQQRMLLPVQDKATPQLDALLAQRTFDYWIDEAIRPEIEDMALLLPGAFRSTRRRALQKMRHRAEACRESAPGEAKVLNRCIRMLMEDEELQELAQMYRSSLYQG